MTSARAASLTLGDLFLPNSDYLETIASYCITELSKQPGFDGPFTDGAKPTPENYRNWNITPDGLLITFDTYQVSPGASGPQQVLVPFPQLERAIDPQGPLAGISQLAAAIDLQSTIVPGKTFARPHLFLV